MSTSISTRLESGSAEVAVFLISLTSDFLIPSFPNVLYRNEAVDKRPGRTFIAFSFEQLAILVWVCFHDDSNASTEEVHMKILSTNRQMPMLCATAAASAADNRALPG